MPSQRWCRFRSGATVSFGLLEGDRVIQVDGSPFEAHTITRTSHALADVKLLPPVIPPMLYVAGPNYKDHIDAMAKRRGKQPVYPTFPEANFRSVHSIVGPDDAIIVPRNSAGRLQPEGQVAVIIGRKARRVSRADAIGHVFGYALGNDVTEREWQAADRTMFRGKNTDTFKPFGPCIATGLDPSNIHVIVRHNGRVTQDFTTAEQLFDIATWVAELSNYTTLHPGDAIWMGTQGADGDMVAGDTIEVEGIGIGVLRNRLVAEA